jgi:hypothetical protein
MGLVFQPGWPPVRRETAEEIRAERVALRNLSKKDDITSEGFDRPRRSFSSSLTAKDELGLPPENESFFEEDFSPNKGWSKRATFKARLREDLQKKGWDNDGYQAVLFHYLGVAMHGGRKEPEAIAYLKRTLDAIRRDEEEGVDLK